MLENNIFTNSNTGIPKSTKTFSDIKNNSSQNLDKNKLYLEEKELINTSISFNQHFSESQKTNIIIRFFLVLFGFALWMLYRYMLQRSDKKWDFPYCFEDRLITKVFYNATIFISQNLYIRDFMLIASSAFLDIFMICFIFVYVTKGNSWAPILHMGLFYGLRGAVVQNLVIMQIYDTYVFEYPGFPSLVVPYFRAADFFYSGHSGCALLLGMQMSDMGYSEMKYVGFILGIFEGVVLTMLRIHYSIDIVFGLITSHYIYFVAKELAVYVDRICPMDVNNNEVDEKNNKTEELAANNNQQNKSFVEDLSSDNYHKNKQFGKKSKDKDNNEFSGVLKNIDSSRALEGQMDEIIEKRK